jgi:hypothetical protein
MTILPISVTSFPVLSASGRDARPSPLNPPFSLQSVPTHRSLWILCLHASLLLLALPATGRSQIVTTQQYDNTRDGVQNHETVLTPSNVSSALFGKLFSLTVSGHVYAQPLYVAALTMPDNTVHNILFVATEQDYVYAFDADGNNPAQGYLWRTSLLGTNETWVSHNDVGTGDIYPDIGVTGTPVIDPSTSTLYVVAKSKTLSGTTQFFQRLHALNVIDGTEKLNGPTTIQATIPGTGDGGTTISFNPLLNNQRAGLLLATTPNGATPASVFITWASHGDAGPYHGWVMSYSASDISQQTGVWSDSPNGTQGGIWLSGGALSSDNAGNVFLAAGNGTFDANTGGSDYGDSALSLSINASTLSPTSYFTPANQGTLNSEDMDMGISSVVLLPTQTAAIPRLAVTADKSGTVYLLNRDKLGGFNPTNNSSVQAFNVNHTLRTSMAFFNNTLYLAGENGPLSAWPLNPATELFPASPASVSSATFGCADCGGAGTTPSISTNGTSNAILWVLDNSARENGPAVLRAYDPSNLQTVLYDSTQAPNNRDAAGIAVKFTTPVNANGHVYVGGVGGVTVYGELSSHPTVSMSAAPASIAQGSSSTLSVTATATTQLTLTGTDGSSYTLSPTGAAQPVSPATTTTYTATATGSSAGSSTSATTTTTVTVKSNSGCLPAGTGAIICAPTAGATISSPVTVTAGATAVSGNIAAIRVYLDNVSALNVSNPSVTKSFQFSQPVTATAGPHTMVLVAYQDAGGTVQASENFTISASAVGSSSCLPASSGATICAPTPGASTSSPVTITAGATAASGNIAAMRAYIDNVAALTVNNPSATKSFQFSQPVAATAGTHNLVIVGYQDTGGTVQASETFAIGGGSAPCLPTAPGAIICTPATNATVSSPVSVSAGATAPSGYLAAIRIYVDNVAQAAVNNPQTSPSFTINQPVTITTGKHSLVIVGYPSAGGSVSAGATITVQ